jgi:hypothetical protein
MKPTDAANATTLVRVKNLDHFLLGSGSVQDVRIQRDIAAEIQSFHVLNKSVERDKLAPNTKSEFTSSSMREKAEVLEIPRTIRRDKSLERLGILHGTTQ